MKVTVVLAMVLVGCMSPVMRFGAGKSAPQAQHDTLNEFVPGRLGHDTRWMGTVMDAKIRVYADDDYRAQNRRWREAFDDRLDYVNAVLTARFGVRLVADYREWPHHAPGATLAEQLAALQQVDPGSDVLTVVGLTSSLSLVTATFEQIGYATVSGRHMIIRGYADLEERNSYKQAFPDLASDELENALATMRGHKNASVFLHELGHNLGADHDPVADTLMSASYSRNATGFSSDAEVTIQRTLDQRLGRASAEAPRSAPAAVQAPHNAPIAVEAPGSAPPAAHKRHHTMHVTVLPNGAIVDGKWREDGQLNIEFSTAAAEGVEIDVLVSKGDGATTATLAKMVDRLKAMGLKNIAFE